MAVRTITGSELLKLDRPLVKTHRGFVRQVHAITRLDPINFDIYWYGEPVPTRHSRRDIFQLVPHTGSTN